MSLIHKALKKAEGGGDAPSGPVDPEEAFTTGPGRFFSGQFSPRTLILLIVALGALGFTVYQKFFRRPKPVVMESSAPPSTVPETAATAPATPLVAPPGAPAMDRLPSSSQGEGSKAVEEPTLPPAIVELMTAGNALAAKGQYDAALAKFQEAATIAPNAAAVWNQIGFAQKRQQHFPEAEKAYRKALELRPEYAEALNNLGVLMAAMGDRLSGTLYLRKALTVDPTYADAHFNVGLIMDKEGNFQSAIEHYKAFLQYTATTDRTLLEQVERRIERLAE